MAYEKDSICLLVAGVVSMLVIAGCGDGDGSSDTSSSPAASTAGGTAAPASAAAIASAPIAVQPASAPAASCQPVTLGEALLSLTTPQTGSMAATAAGPVGIWSSSGSGGLGSTTIAFVDPHSNLTTIYALSSFVASEDFSTLTVNGNTWSLGSGMSFNDTTGFTTKSILGRAHTRRSRRCPARLTEAAQHRT
ncbi:hypothetical protein [Burkholderia ubonensis]|uniref:hypothetical protein n=1 Tax=Burkholderia ubonensis TaxID=101571 RepID=UPI0018DF87B4|nr:hypothetical protein [Burkholderia ubonensis]